MRKLIFLLMIMVLPLGFTACGSDDDEEEQKETWGQDMNPIEGTWEREDSNRKYVFTADFKVTVYWWDKVLLKWDEYTTTEYVINEKSFKYSGVAYDYRLEGNDILHIKSRAPGGKLVKYNRVTE